MLYRLSRALKAAGRPEEAEAFDLRVRAAKEARDQILPLYEEANAVKNLGVAPHPDLYRRLADLRERMGRHDEALAWHRLVLRDQPDDPVSRRPSRRLQAMVDERNPDSAPALEDAAAIRPPMNLPVDPGGDLRYLCHRRGVDRRREPAKSRGSWR